MLQRYNSCNSLSAQNSRGKKNQESNQGTLNIFAVQNFMVQPQSQNRMVKHSDSIAGSIMDEFAAPFRMFDQITKHMGRMFDGFGDMNHDEMQSRNQGCFTSVQRVFAMQRKVGAGNQVFEEKYFSNNVAQKDSAGNIISEKQEAYKNNFDKRDFIAQERKLNNQGRKHVQERVNGQKSSTNYFLNLNEDDIDQFDNTWNDYSQKQQFHKGNCKQLGYGGIRAQQDDYSDDLNHEYYNWGQPFKDKENRFNKTQPQKNKKTNQNNQKTQQSNKNYKDFNFQDEQRRGDFIPTSVRNEDQVVRVNNVPSGYGRRSSGLKPTVPQQQNNRRSSVTVQPAIQPTQPQIQSNNNTNTQSHILDMLTRQNQTSTQNNNINTNNNQSNTTNIRSNHQETAGQQNNVQQRESVSIQPRTVNPQPVRNSTEAGVFMNKNNIKGQLPRAG